MKILALGSGKGEGLAMDNKTKKETFMKMFEIQAGLGFGVKKFRVVWVFETPETLDKFVNSGWELGGQTSVAAKAGVSKNHLSWEFARETGETLTEYISRVRIEEAKRLFSSTSLKVYEVAEKVGFGNVEHFSRVFKKLAGASPSAWPGPVG